MLIQQYYELPNYRAIYRHARATGLYPRCRENLRFAAELLIEHADQVAPNPETIHRAIHTCARTNARGVWTDSPSDLIVSRADTLAPTEPRNSSPKSP